MVVRLRTKDGPSLQMPNREAASNLLQLFLVHGTKHNLGMYTSLIGLNFDFLLLGFSRFEREMNCHRDPGYLPTAM
jgi:hypothetical protein